VPASTNKVRHRWLAAR